jgi:glycerol-3-phosphate acyltransferase PlsY
MNPGGVLVFVGVFLGCFLLGSLNPAHFIATQFGHDIHGSGSGNPGATNAGRLLGVHWGILIAALDILKAFLPVFLLTRFAGLDLALVGGFAVVLGHMFSPFLRGKGGKGVAAAFGGILAVAPWIALGGVVVFVLAAVGLHRMGRGALITFGMTLVLGVLIATRVLPWADPHVGWWLVAVSALVVARHRVNFDAWVRRLT